ncbi:MAG: TlpA disulfide reductase family protein [Planctomycetota bacterium]
MNPRSLAVAALATLCTTVAANPFAPASATLTSEPTKIIDSTAAITAGGEAMEAIGRLGFSLGTMRYVPTRIELTTEKPAIVAIEPDYEGEVRYGLVQLGAGGVQAFPLVLDTTEHDCRLYIDTNGNGDLTDDGDGSWPNRRESEGSLPSFSGAYAFHVSYDDTEEPLPFGLNFYHRLGDESVMMYRAGAMVGEITIAGETMPVALVDQSNTGDYSTGFSLDGGYGPSNRSDYSVVIILNGRSFDARGSFEYEGVNYIARSVSDGARIIVEPTPRIIPLPERLEARRETAERTMLAAGDEIPEFEAVLASGEPLDLHEMIGERVIVLDLWATWCGPCKVGMEHLAALEPRLDDGEVVIVALNVQDTQRAFDTFVDAKQDEYDFVFARDPIGRDRDMSIAGRIFGVRGIPATFIIGLDGTVTSAISGASAEDTRVEEALRDLGVTIADAVN